MNHKLENIKSAIEGACQLIRSQIALTLSELMSPRGLFEIDLTQPYINQVSVNANDINVNQFVLSLPNDAKVYSFDTLQVDVIANYMLSFASTLTSGATWESMTVEDALAKLPQDERERNIRKAIALSSPMCPLNYQGYINPSLNNYYYIGVQEQSSTGLRGTIINLDSCIPAGDMHAIDFASIGSRDRIVIYHQYGVFPTYAIAGTDAYRMAHDRYANRVAAYSCFIDENIRTTMIRDSFSLLPQERTDNSLELWVKGIIFGLITRDGNGVYQYKDEDNRDNALFGYITSLGTTYRDEAFRNFKRESERLQPQYEQHMINRAHSEGQDAIDAIIAKAKLSYLTDFSLNELSLTQLRNPLYHGIAEQLTNELNYVKQEL